jgi:hypothetical protein
MLSAGGNGEEAYLIEGVVNHRKRKNNIEYLIKWVGYPSDENSWEPLSEIQLPASRLIDTYLERCDLDTKIWNPKIKRSSRKISKAHRSK